MSAALSLVSDYYSDQFPKRCLCCGSTYTQAEWERLPLLGYQPVEADPLDSPPEAHLLELRNCNGARSSGRDCLTTIAVQVRHG